MGILASHSVHSEFGSAGDRMKASRRLTKTVIQTTIDWTTNHLENKSQSLGVAKCLVVMNVSDQLDV